MSVRPTSTAIFAVMLALAFPVDAWAYLDPGTGSYLFQLAAAGLFASMMTIKIYWQRIRNWFSAANAPTSSQPPPSADGEPTDAGDSKSA